MRNRNTKSIAGRIDVNYVRGGSPLMRYRQGITLICAAVSLAWIEISYFRGAQTMYNPGPVASVHANWEQNCTICHDGGGQKGFFQSVSDQACLNCHDGAIHHPNQVTLVSKSADGTPLRSEHCTTCHVEHRGREALIGTSDAACVKCHGNLSGKSKSLAADVPANITAFDNGTHPHFGRRLKDKTGQLVDPTRVRFNHKKHRAPTVKPLEGQAENCTKCHRAVDSRMAPGSGAVIGALKGETPTPAEAVSVSDGLYMLPVSFDRDCAECHAIQLPWGTEQQPTLPHKAMSQLREALDVDFNDLSAFYARWARSQPDLGLQGESAEKEWVNKNVPAKLKDLRTALKEWAGRPSDPDHENKLAALVPAFDHWAKEAGEKAEGGNADEDDSAKPKRRPGKSADAAEEESPKPKKKPGKAADAEEEESSTPKKRRPGKAADADAEVSGPAGKTDQELSALTKMTPEDVLAVKVVLEDALAYRSLDTTKLTYCAKCHDMVAAPRVFEEQKLPATRPESAPTGIPPTPRRWFTASRFSHRAHQNVLCASCHSNANTSEKTSDVLSPDLTWIDHGETVSCANCHHTSRSIDRGAGSNCLTCHIFHDRGREGLPGQPRTVHEALHGPTTLPAGPATKPAGTATASAVKADGGPS